MKLEDKSHLRNLLRLLITLQDDVTHLNEHGASKNEIDIKIHYRDIKRDEIVNFVETLVDATQQPLAPDGASRPRCKVCGTTNHHIDENGFVVDNPPRR